MRFSIGVHSLRQCGEGRGVEVQPAAGLVNLNGLFLLPHEAAALADALTHCAECAQVLGHDAVKQLQPAL